MLLDQLIRLGAQTTAKPSLLLSDSFFILVLLVVGDFLEEDFIG